MRLKTFGRLALEGAALTRPKPLLLLAYLAVEGPKPRQHLAELFYMDASDPLNSLTKALGFLRKDAPGSFGADGKRAWATVPSDVADFLAADTGRLEPLADLYRGAFAEDVSKLGAELEEWVLGTREYLAGRLRQALLQQAEREAGAGRSAQAAKHAERAYVLPGAPEPEPDQFARIYALLAAGGSPRAAAVRSAAEDYGIPLVSPQEVWAATPSEWPSTPHNLPPAKTSFVGRERELSEIAENLTDPDCRLLTLHGMGGVGKSRLALQAAWAAVEAGRFAGVYFAPLDALPNPDLIPGTVAEQLGLRLEGPGDALAQLAAHIGTTPLLIILDNYEHLMSAATLPARLLEACPNLKLIVTSREVLRLEEEWVMPLDGLSYPARAASLVDAAAYEAVSLFLQRAKRTRLDYRPAEEDVSAILKICELTEGSPLALELAATWVKLLPIQEIAGELYADFDLLSAAIRNRPFRHQAMRTVLAHSWSLLSDAVQRAYRLLAVFRGGFRREAAAEVAGVTLPVLASLTDKALLKTLPNGRYDRHALLYQFALERLAEHPEEKAQAQATHRAYFLAFLRARHDQPQRFYEVDEELANILGAAETVREARETKHAVEIARLLALGKSGQSYLDKRGHSAYIFQLLRTAADQAGALEDWDAAYHLLSRLGHLYYERLGDYDAAFDTLSEALTHARKLGHAHMEAVTLSQMGVQRFRRDGEEAERYFQEATDLATANLDDRALFVVLQHRGYVSYFREAWDAMRRFSVEALEVLARLELLPGADPHDIAHRRFFGLLNLGKAEFSSGRHDAALAHIYEALSLAETQENEIWQAFALDDLGEVHHASGHRAQAKTYLWDARKLYEKNNVAAHLEKIKAFIDAEGYGEVVSSR